MRTISIIAMRGPSTSKLSGISSTGNSSTAILLADHLTDKRNAPTGAFFVACISTKASIAYLQQLDQGVSRFARQHILQGIFIERFEEVLQRFGQHVFQAAD